MRKKVFFIVTSVILFILCLVFLVSFISLRKSSVNRRLEDEHALKEILKRRDKIKSEIEEFRNELKELNEVKKELANSLDKQKKINKLIEKQVEEFKNTKNNMEFKYNEYIKELKQFKDKLDSDKDQ